MRQTLRLADALGKLVERIGLVASWAFVILVAVIMVDVIGRHFFSIGSSKLQELEWHLHTVLFMFCIGLGLMHDSHVRIDIVRERLAPRTQCWIEIAGCLLFLIPFCLLVIYYGWELTSRSWEKGEISSSAAGLPYRWLIKSAIPVGMSVLLLGAISSLLRSIVKLRQPGLAEAGAAVSGQDASALPGIGDK